jgi:Leucine-rich repeat (LRR) protein
VATFEPETKEVSCETFVYFHWVLPVQKIQTCFMDTTTSVDSPGIKVSSNDSSIKGLRFYNNKQIQYLPVEVAKKFPNLLVYSVASCSLKNLLKLNFEGLEKLKLLYLNGNQIETIETGTFKDLVDLEVLCLSKKYLQIKMPNF